MISKYEAYKDEVKLAKELTICAIENRLIYSHEATIETADEVLDFYFTVLDGLIEKNQTN